MHSLKITKIIDESPQVKTFYFTHQLKSRPGQFVMLWLPGIDQKPFSISSDDDQTFGLTIFQRGALTEKLFAMKINDRVGIAGPYGTSFSIKPDIHYIMIAGGYGAAPLAFLAEELIKKGNNDIDFCLGARNKDCLLFAKRLNNVRLHIATDDGSVGQKGLATNFLPEIINADARPKLVVACGPELMEKKILDICNQYNVDAEISIERYMKCGVGICGQCAVDNLGICLCVNGPVVTHEIANKIEEFGIYHRAKNGQKVYFNK
ncbi:MAG: dihydroorotate dehydrogenase electron transfer subunit [Patescibacteria group bacterium]